MNQSAIWTEAADLTRACLNVHSSYAPDVVEFAEHLREVFRTRAAHPDYRHSVRVVAEATSCLWKYDPDGYWKTGCGEGFMLSNEESLSANTMRFCHACGKRIEEQALVPVETEQ